MALQSDALQFCLVLCFDGLESQFLFASELLGEQPDEGVNEQYFAACDSDDNQKDVSGSDDQGGSPDGHTFCHHVNQGYCSKAQKRKEQQYDGEDQQEQS